MAHFDEVQKRFTDWWLRQPSRQTGQFQLSIDGQGRLTDQFKFLPQFINSLCDYLLEKSEAPVKEIKELKESIEADSIPSVFGKLFQEKYEQTGFLKLLALFNTPYKRELSEKLEELLSNAQSEILMIGWIDAQYLPQLKDAKERGVNLRIVTKKPPEGEPSLESAHSRVIEFVGKDSMKRNIDCHSRLLICDVKECLISTADFNVFSSTSHYEAGIYINYPKVVYEARKHFEEIWNDSSTKPYK